MRNVRDLFSPFIAQLNLMNKEGIFHGDIKPANIVLVHKNNDFSKKLISLSPLLIDFHFGEDFTYTLWFCVNEIA